MKNKHSWITLLVFFIIIIIAYIIIKSFYPYLFSPITTYNPPQPQYREPTARDLFTIKINKFAVGEYNYFEIIGEIKNISSNSYKFVSVQATFYDKNNNAVGQNDTYACGTDYILPGANKSFKFMGEYKPEYNTVRCEIVSFKKIE